MARTRAANPATVADAIAQLQEMNDGARSELAAGRRRSAGAAAPLPAKRGTRTQHVNLPFSPASTPSPDRPGFGQSQQP